MAIIRVKPGVVTAQDGTYPELRGGRKGGLLSQDVGGRYEEAAYRGSVYSAATAGGGVALAATHLFSTAIATFTPILAVYNPLTNNKNFSVLAAWAGLHSGTATQATTGGLLFVVNSGQSITNAQSATPVSHNTFKASGSSAIGISNAALAGAVGNVIVLRPLQALIQSGTVTSQTMGLAVLPMEFVEGSIIIPPGGYLGIATGVSIATGNVVAGVTFEEIPL
jgi:hypothetical protein